MSVLNGEEAVLEVVRQTESLGAAADLDYGLRMLDAAKHGKLGPTLRLYRPQPTMAFGQRDARLPGFPEAAELCRQQGFEPLVRKAGGRAAAYHRGCLIVDHVEPQPDAIRAARQRFAHFGDLFAGALTSRGVAAAVGEIPGEYCPGEFSVHGADPADGRRLFKLVGTAQRVVSGAWLFSSVIVVEDSGPLREVMTGAYAALGLDWDPVTAGAVADLAPLLDVDAVAAAVLDAYAPLAALAERPLDDLLADVPADVTAA
jgi:octanoyl-[GcvH]:protein N-octanoyltransferase